MELGLSKGLQARSVEIAKNMLRKGIESSLVQELTGLTLGKLQTLK
jgi:hypothetical protein